MSEPFVGEIRMFAGNFAPRGWAFCDGQLLAVSQNDALYSLYGTIYGGDGRTTFGLPDLRGRIPIHAGTGPGLSPRRLGSKSGAEKVTLTVNQVPSHSHTFSAINSPATETAPPAEGTLAQSVGYDLYVPPSGFTNMAAANVDHVGGSRDHTNEMPYLCVHFIVALFGIYPSRH
jgi:microcystin-dependent protein